MGKILIATETTKYQDIKLAKKKKKCKAFMEKATKFAKRSKRSPE